MDLTREELDDLLCRLEKEKIKVTEESREVRRRIRVVDDVLSWNLLPSNSPARVTVG